MKLPNKIISFNESVLSKCVPILNEVQNNDIGVITLFHKTESCYNSFEEYIDALDCLFAMKKIEYIAEKGVLHYII